VEGRGAGEGGARLVFSLCRFASTADECGGTVAFIAVVPVYLGGTTVPFTIVIVNTPTPFTFELGTGTDTTDPHNPSTSPSLMVKAKVVPH
jgi:hypothetical protein